MEEGITLLLAALLICGGFATILLYRAVSTLGALLQLVQKWGQPPDAEIELRYGRLDNLIDRCRSDIEKTPMYTKAHWYLARAYYARQMWVEARRELETVGELEPSWRREHTQPYIDEIDKRLHEEKA